MNHGLDANHSVLIMIGLILRRPRSRFSSGVQVLDSVSRSPFRHTVGEF